MIVRLNSGAAVGADGSATANEDSNHAIRGRVLGVYVDYQGTPPATTDVVIKGKGTNAPSVSILSLTNANTDGWFYPRAATCGTTGVADSFNGEIPIDDVVNVSIAGANANDYVDVYLMVE